MANNQSIESLHDEFIKKVEQRFGKFMNEQFRFQEASNSEVARELNYSDAQFSRLIHLSASEGEYLRAIRNIDRILNEIKLENQIEKLKNKAQGDAIGRFSILKPILFIVVGGIISIIGYFIIYNPSGSDQAENEVPKDYTLKWSFESAFVSPYTKLSQLPEDCDFPCYKYQGKWELKKPYKLPFFREQNGFHYLATEVNMYARCMTEEQSDGTLLEGYEYQKHEIWYDKRKLPIDSFVNLDNRKKILPEYQSLDFSKDENFIKIAYVHTFFKNEFKINEDTIERSGKVIGRDIKFIPTESLLKYLPSEAEIGDLTNQINRIVFNRLQDFSRPIDCETTFVPNPDFHRISEGDEISFNCTLTTGRVPLNYEKTYVLIDQYIENSCQPASP
ncbi:hypothetical protein QYS49_25055 [Marivirga salinae]|uniref:Uncharacterized protein n=1 Tax=Marivirga salinarum TaxID=3059078 RepID=A0AA49GBV8_9BACT|nr:hypothetical protein [Marivirga sp. BDSF4-3]WKK74899.2 hypothetical protein QYS49_25055 [Marivirga sp. BDSF4-3]